jgi:hypothetical protein
MQKTGQTATPLEGGIDSAEKAASRKSFARQNIRTKRISLLNILYRMFA